MSTQIRKAEPFQCGCLCFKIGGPPDPRDYELNSAEKYKSKTVKSFGREMPFPMCSAPIQDPLCCIFNTCCPYIAACTQRKRILKLEGKDYYKCLNLDDRLAKIWCCSEDSMFQSCNCLDKKIEGDCMISTCALAEACVCLTLSAQANRWSVQRLGGFRNNCCEDSIVWFTDCCLEFWSKFKYCWRLSCFCLCIALPPCQHPMYYFTGGFFCETCESFWSLVYMCVMGCWQTQTGAAIEVLENEAKTGSKFEHVKNLSWYKPLETKIEIPQGAQPGQFFDVKVPDGRTIKVECPSWGQPGVSVIINYQPDNGAFQMPGAPVTQVEKKQAVEMM